MRRNGVGEGGEGSGGQLFVGGGCLCSSLRCRIVLRDCVVFDHPLGSSSPGSYDRLSVWTNQELLRHPGRVRFRVGLGLG